MKSLEYYAAPPADLDTLAKLGEALHGSQGAITPEAYAEAIADYARMITPSIRSAQFLIEYTNFWAQTLPTIIEKWNELSPRSKMLFREFVENNNRTERLANLLTENDRQALLNALEPDVRQRFVFAQRQNLLVANALRERVALDKDLKRAPSGATIWNLAKRLFPSFEDALSRPLDRSKYVDRNVRKTPRKSTG